MPDPTTTGLSNSQSYDTSSPDVVIDAVTHLMWQRILDPAPGQSWEQGTWDEAKARCGCLSVGGYHDWRVPTRIELVSIVDFTRADPAIDAVAFAATPSDYFWTSSTLSGETSTAWYVFFLDGNAHSGDEQSAYRVRCIRSMESPTSTGERYTILADGTVFDTKTKLTWERTTDLGTFAWSDAKAHCASLALAGGGWRLPNMKELQTLVDESVTAPAIDSVAFPDTPSEAHWTSSLLVGGPTEAWFVNFFSGVSYTSVLDHPYRARCVR